MKPRDHGLAGDQSPADRAALTVFVVAPPVALATGIRRLWKREKVGGTDLAMLAVMHMIGSLGITVGFHRMLAHQSFKARPGVRKLLIVMGSMAVQGQPSHWVGDHRKHHAFTDREGDPHSPHLSSFRGIRGKVAGMLHAHVGWLFSMDQSSIEKHAPGILKDEDVMAIDRQFGKITFLSLFAIPFTVGALHKRSLRGGLRTAFWAGPVRLALTQHITWSVNSVCHVFGSRPFGRNNRTGESTNNWVIGLLAWGEGWHHNHHQDSRSARHGILPGQVDLSWYVIKALEKLGLVWDVRKPTDEEIREWLEEARRKEEAERAASLPESAVA